MGQLKTKNDNKPEQVATKNFSQVFDFIDIICYHLLPIKRLKRFAKPLYGESCIVGSNPIPSAIRRNISSKGFYECLMKRVDESMIAPICFFPRA